METSGLSDGAYWADETPDLRFNPVGSGTQQGMMAWIASRPEFRSQVLVATSGSGGDPAWVVLSKAALRASARAVNRHLAVTAGDHWLCALPDFHVGGLGVHARAFEAGIGVTTFPGRWRGRAREFAACCARAGVTLTSLTPTQVHDLVREEIPAPTRLRAVVVGGGRLSVALGEGARALGWPVLASYGMTEAGSQIATEALTALEAPYSGEWLPVLPGWEVIAGDRDRLSIRGSALCSGHLRRTAEGGWEFEKLADWFETSDRGELRSTAEGGLELKFLGRMDDLVKRLGELISLDRIRQDFDEELAWSGLAGTVLALPDERAGHRLVAVFEGDETGEAALLRTLERFNARHGALERIEGWQCLPELPRTALGKIAFGALRSRWRESAERRL